MPTQFLDLTNELLRRLNEVQISQANFASVQGVQAMAKDAVDASIEHILQQEYTWPFEAVSGTQLLVVGQEDYDWPSDMKVPKWNSFHVVKDVLLNEYGHPLKFISRDLYHSQLKDDDDNAGSDGRSVPQWVCEKHGFGFTVSPSPDQAYTVSFDYWAKHTALVDYDDTSLIPSNYDEVIIQGALYHFYMFRDNSEQAQMAEMRFDRQLKNMRSLLINKEDRIRSSYISWRRRPSFNQDYFT